MSDIVRYLEEEKQINPTPSGAREFIEDLEELIRESRADTLEFRELLAALIFSCVEKDETAWRLMSYQHDVERVDYLLDKLVEMEDMSPDKRTRVRVITEIIRRLKESEIKTGKQNE